MAPEGKDAERSRASGRSVESGGERGDGLAPIGGSSRSGSVCANELTVTGLAGR